MPERISTVDYHTAGHAFRIVTAGVPEIPGGTMLARRDAAAGAFDRFRRLLCHEPRGHRDCYGCFLTRPVSPDAHLGALFWHADGYSTACGHGTIALGTWAVESGLVPASADGTTEVVMDVPSGRVTARVRHHDGVVTGVAFRNVASTVLARDMPVRTAQGPVPVDAAYAGAVYLSVPAAACGLAVTPADLPALLAVAAQARAAVGGPAFAEAVGDARLSEVYGVTLYEDVQPGAPEAAVRQRSVTVFADGKVDRSPSGSGTCARAALLAAEGRLSEHGRFVHESIIGSRFVATLVARDAEGCHVDVDGRAFRTGEHTFLVQPGDELGTGFLLDDGLP